MRVVNLHSGPVVRLLGPYRYLPAESEARVVPAAIRDRSELASHTGVMV
jgi:hypothetical protein